MIFKVARTQNGWTLTPLSGKFEGEVVASADGVNLRSVRFAGKTATGIVKALWGASLSEEVYEDVETLRGLGLGGVFDLDVHERLYLDFDGFSAEGNVKMRGAKKVVFMGTNVYAKGAQ